MKAVEAIAEILKREGIDMILGYPVNHVLEYSARADIRSIICRRCAGDCRATRQRRSCWQRAIKVSFSLEGHSI